MRRRRYWIILGFLTLLLGSLPMQSLYAQEFWETSDTLHPPRLRTIAIGSSVTYGTALIGLNELWYKNYPRSSFHFLYDSDEWLQIDKVGHMTTAYYESYIFCRMLRWAGVSHNKRTWYGGLAGFVLQTPIEILDGFSKHWGASKGDLLTNALGSGIFIAQEKLWQEQKFRLKFSFSPTRYADIRPEQLGENLVQQSLKDYNGQTYWLSSSVNNFIPNADPLPRWLDLSAGYGGQGMIGGPSNPSEYDHIPRYRQYYLSLDINTAKIKTGKKGWDAVLHALSFIKWPMPALEYNNQVGLKGHWLYF